MLIRTLKTVLVAGFLLAAVGLAGCDDHHHHRRHIRAGRGHDVHRRGEHSYNNSFDSRRNSRIDDFGRASSSRKVSVTRKTKSPPTVYKKDRDFEKTVVVFSDEKFRSKSVSPRRRPHRVKKTHKNFRHRK